MLRGPFTTEPSWPGDLMSSRKLGIRRMGVEVGDTGQDDGRVFRLPREFSISDVPLVIRAVAPVDFKIRFQQLTVDVGGIVMRAYRAGTEGGTWTPETTFNTNDASYVPSYTPQLVFSSGGTFTPSGVAAEVIRVRTSGATAQQTTVSGTAGDTRLLGAGTYYLVFSRMAGVTGTCQGVYTLRYEEFPVSAQ